MRFDWRVEVANGDTFTTDTFTKAVIFANAVPGHAYRICFVAQSVSGKTRRAYVNPEEKRLQDYEEGGKPPLSYREQVRFYFTGERKVRPRHVHDH